MNHLQPVAGVSRNPMLGLQMRDMQVVPVGVTIASLAPDPDGGLLVCKLNGEWLLRAYWVELTQPCDQLEWHIQPRGREVIRVLLQVALIVAAIWFPAAVPYLIAANAAYNLLVPPRAPNQNQEQTPGSVFSTSLAGNAARLDQPIWRNCGRVKITPSFAGWPYTEFLPSDPDHPRVDCDQYYYAILAIGVGNHELEKEFIGKTAISHFADVLVAEYLPPGTQPARAKANVITSDEVSSALELDTGTYVGGYAACRPGDTVKSIGIDVAASQGLSGTAAWQVEIREIDNFGRPVGDWAVIGEESETASTNTPQRWTNTYTPAAPIRCEVRLVRTNDKDTDPAARDGIQWIGLRAYLSKPAPLNEHTAHYEVVMRASEQLSSLSQRDFSMIVRALVRTWNPDTGWGPEVFTRNAAWWLADLWTNPIWGLGVSDDRIDLEGLYDWAQTLDARQDHFDYCFAQGQDADAAAQLIAHSGRARAFRRHGAVFSVARDELVDLAVTAFTPRNTVPKSMVLHAVLPKREQADGYVVQYQSNVTWDTATIECPCPGFTVTDPDDVRGDGTSRYDASLPAMTNPVFMSLDGVTGAFHAEREGLYQAASMALRQTTVSAQAEMEGAVVGFMDPVRWQPQIVGYGQSGDVAFWDESTLVMGLSEPAVFDDEDLYLVLVRDDGTLTTPVIVTPGPTANDVRLPAPPDFALVLDDGLRERPKFILGPLTGGDEIAKISSIGDGGKSGEGTQLFNLEAVIDDDAVHLRDNALLPGPGDIQDPIDDGSDFGDDTGGGSAHLVRLRDHVLLRFGAESPYTGGTAGFTLHADGTADEFFAAAFADVGAPTVLPQAGEWLTGAPVEPDIAAEFECYASDPGAGVAALTAAGATIGGTYNAWLPLSADRTWSLTVDPSLIVPDHLLGGLTLGFTVSIRRIGGSIVYATRDVFFTILSAGT